MQTCSSRSSHKTFLLSFKELSVCSELSLLSQWDKSTKRAVLWLVLCMWMRMLSNTFLLCLGGDRNSSAKSERLGTMPPFGHLGQLLVCCCYMVLFDFLNQRNTVFTTDHMTAWSQFSRRSCSTRTQSPFTEIWELIFTSVSLCRCDLWHTYTNMAYFLAWREEFCPNVTFICFLTCYFSNSKESIYCLSHAS